jgi:uncharacterized small protein (DUF1192 family)
MSATDEENVTNDFVEAINHEVVNAIGYGSGLRHYDWAEEVDGHEQDGTWPFVVERDGRRFEVDIDVRVVELTPERIAARQAEHERIVAMIKAHDARKAAES